MRSTLNGSSVTTLLRDGLIRPGTHCLATKMAALEGHRKCPPLSCILFLGALPSVGCNCARVG